MNMKRVLVRRTKQIVMMLSVAAVLTVSCTSVTKRRGEHASELAYVPENSHMSDDDLDVPLREDSLYLLPFVPETGTRGVNIYNNLTITDWLIKYNFYNSTSIAADYQSHDIDSFIEFYKLHSYGLILGVKRAISMAYMVIPSLRRRGIPSDFIFLPIIESGYNPELFSVKGAAGVWQFMPGTAANFGLKIKTSIDERRDMYKSAEAAANYLAELYRRLGDWSLVVAGYNVGEARIEKLVKEFRKSHPDAQRVTFWDIKNGLPAETRGYVPRFFAILKIVHNPDRYGFSIFDSLKIGYAVKDTLKAVKIVMNKSTDIKKLARLAGLYPSGFLNYNPHITSDMIPAGETLTIYLPLRNVEALERNIIIESESQEENGDLLAQNNGASQQTHIVRDGETIEDIANTYGVTVKEIRQLNGLTTNRVYPGQVILLPTSERMVSR